MVPLWAWAGGQGRGPWSSRLGASPEPINASGAQVKPQQREGGFSGCQQNLQPHLWPQSQEPTGCGSHPGSRLSGGLMAQEALCPHKQAGLIGKRDSVGGTSGRQGLGGPGGLINPEGLTLVMSWEVTASCWRGRG